MAKKYSILILFYFFFSIYLNAQRLSLGLTFALDRVNQKFISELPNPMPFSPRLSYSFGFKINLKILDYLELQYEPSFIEKGSLNIDTQYDQKTVWKYGYFSNPLVFILKPIKKVGCEFGTELSALLYSKRREFDGSITDLNGAKIFEFSGILGINYYLLENTSIFIRYSKSFTPIYNELIHGNPSGSFTYKIYNDYFTLGLRYNFLKIKL